MRFCQYIIFLAPAMLNMLSVIISVNPFAYYFVHIVKMIYTQRCVARRMKSTMFITIFNNFIYGNFKFHIKWLQFNSDFSALNLLVYSKWLEIINCVLKYLNFVIDSQICKSILYQILMKSYVYVLIMF